MRRLLPLLPFAAAALLLAGCGNKGPLYRPPAQPAASATPAAANAPATPAPASASTAPAPAATAPAPAASAAHPVAPA